MKVNGFIIVLLAALTLIFQVSTGYWRVNEYSKATGTSFIKSIE